jgi:hypothetical protein
MREFTVDDKNVSFHNLISVKGKLFMFTSQYDKESKSSTYYVQGIDIRTLNPSGPNRSIGSFEAINRTSQSDVGIELSEDSSKLLLFGMSPFSKKGNEKYYMAIYDPTMKKQWEQTVVLPYLDKFVQVLDYMVTNDGRVGVILKHYDKEVSKESVTQDGSKVPAYKTKFLLYTNGDAKPKEYLLNLQDKFVHNLRVTNNTGNTLQLFGLYKNKYDGYVNGYFLSSIDLNTQDVTVRKMESFPGRNGGTDQKRQAGKCKGIRPGIEQQFQAGKSNPEGQWC